MASIAAASINDDLQAARIDPHDLTRADLWAEDRWQEPMRELRARGPIHWNDASKFGPHWSVVSTPTVEACDHGMLM